jgi:hypothetical protein
MEIIRSRLLWGALLILAGVVFLLDSLQVVSLGGYFITVLFALGGLFFLSVYTGNRQQWWALIPGFVLLSLAALIFINEAFPNRFENLGGVIFLGGIGLAFLLVYLTQRENWWAVIPAGVMFTVAIISGIGDFVQGEMVPGVLFLGLALTFALVALLPNSQGRMTWAYIPAGILAVMGLLFLAAQVSLVNFVWPVALILLGLFLIGRTYLWKR